MTDRTLRSNFTPGSTPWAMRRAQWTALGLTESDLVKPKIAIVNSSSSLASCFSHLDQIVGPLKEAITAAGGVAFEVRTAAPSDAITCAGAAGQYILPSRDLIAADIEVAVEGALLDGMVCLASCDKTTPGQLMAAGRQNIPTIIVACGYQPSGMYRGEAVDFEDIFRFAGHVNAGRMTIDELGEMSRCAVTLGEAIASVDVDPDVIRPLDKPLATHPAIVVMRGSLAPDGAVLKRTVADDAPLAFRGPAKVVRSRDEGVAAARAGRFHAGDVIVLTGLGLRGSPGMGLTSALMFAIDGAGLSTSVAVITDGQMGPGQRCRLPGLVDRKQCTAGEGVRAERSIPRSGSRFFAEGEEASAGRSICRS